MSFLANLSFITFETLLNIPHHTIYKQVLISLKWFKIEP